MIVPQTIQVSNLGQPGGHRHRCPRSGCTSSFSRKSDLTRHDRTHTQLRPYKCEWPKCDKAFNQKGQLKTHRNTHTGEKPHSCEFCSKRFSDPASRTRHRKEAHGEIKVNKCDFCPSRIKRLRAFQIHLRDKHGIEWSSNMELVPQRTPDNAPVQRLRRGAYVVPPFDMQSLWESGESPSPFSDTQPTGFRSETPYLSPGTFSLRQTEKASAPWQQDSRAVSPFRERSYASSPGSHSTESPPSHVFREFSPAESHIGSISSSEPSIHTSLQNPDTEHCVEPVNSRFGRYNESFSLERQIHAQKLRAWHSDTNLSKGPTLPIDPTLLLCNN